MVIYYANGKKETLAHVRVSWEGLKEIVASGTKHSYVEFVFPRKSPGLVLIVNEEGHVHQLPFNRDASLLYSDDPQSVAGDVLVVTRDEYNRYIKNEEDDEV